VFTDSATVGPGVQGIGATPFGWGAGIADYDNDGDSDIVYFGNLTVNVFATADNPGVIYKNDGCNAQFSFDKTALASTAAFVERQDVEGMALGDLNGDGFVDIAYAAGQYIPETVPVVKVPTLWGGVFDDTANFVAQFTPIGPWEFEWSGGTVEDGYMGMQVSSASNGNRWAKVSVLGTVGLTTLGKVNRDGIGAIVKFTPKNGKASMTPVLGGSSHASQHALEQGFGLGHATSGTVDVQWPGGVKNRLYDVAASEHVTIPEVPCDYSAAISKRAFLDCEDAALDELVSAGTIDQAMASRLRQSAKKAYGAAH
jgi:hypothetical protein